MQIIDYRNISAYMRAIQCAALCTTFVCITQISYEKHKVKSYQIQKMLKMRDKIRGNERTINVQQLLTIVKLACICVNQILRIVVRLLSFSIANDWLRGDFF